MKEEIFKERAKRIINICHSYWRGDKPYGPPVSEMPSSIESELRDFAASIAATPAGSEAPVANTRAAFMAQLLTLIAKYDAFGELYWRSDLTYFSVNCNDVFAWGTSEGEEVTPDNIDQLESAFADCAAISSTIGEIYGPWLFAARNRKMRPQGASYPEEREPWPLFDACGPERKVGFGNPYKPGDYKPSGAVATPTIERALNPVVDERNAEELDAK
jgi:hypothetical protein